MMLPWLLPLLLLLDAEGDPPDPEGDPDPDPDGEPEEQEEIRDPKAKIAALEDRVERLHRRISERDERIKELEEGGSASEDLRQARIESAFLREVMAREEQITDLDTAWDLADLRGYFDALKISDAGDVEGMAESLDRLTERYPYLVDDEPDVTTPAPPSRPSGRPMNQGKKGSKGLDRASLRERFPALRRGRH